MKELFSPQEHTIAQARLRGVTHGSVVDVGYVIAGLSRDFQKHTVALSEELLRTYDSPYSILAEPMEVYKASYVARMPHTANMEYPYAITFVDTRERAIEALYAEFGVTRDMNIANLWQSGFLQEKPIGFTRSVRWLNFGNN